MHRRTDLHFRGQARVYKEGKWSNIMTDTDRGVYEDRMASWLDELSAEAKELLTEFEPADAEATGRYREVLRDLSRKQDDAKAKLKQLEQASDDAWDELRGGVDSAVSELRDAIENASSRVKSAAK
jgi:uncharacterized protein YjbJ (UPF0337 family)